MSDILHTGKQIQDLIEKHADLTDSLAAMFHGEISLEEASVLYWHCRRVPVAKIADAVKGRSISRGMLRFAIEPWPQLVWTCQDCKTVTAYLSRSELDRYPPGWSYRRCDACQTVAPNQRYAYDDTTCAHCGKDIARGDPIGWLGPDTVVHPRCETAARKLRQTAARNALRQEREQAQVPGSTGLTMRVTASGVGRVSREPTS